MELNKRNKTMSYSITLSLLLHKLELLTIEDLHHITLMWAKQELYA